MKSSQLVQLDIISNGMNGEGIARLDGKVVFVPYTLAGERVLAQVKTVKSRYMTCSAVKVLSPSPYRVAPQCPYYFKCDGCDMAHVTPEYRQQNLVDELVSNFKKIAKTDISDVQFVACERVAGRRNKLSMPFGTKGGAVVAGFYRQNTHVVQPVECNMSSEAVRGVVKKVCDFATARHIPVYNFETGKGLLRHISVREAGGRIAAVLVIAGDSLGQKNEAELSEILRGVDLFVSPHTQKNNVIMGKSVRLVSGNPFLPVEVLGVKAELSPLSFFQVNDEIRDKLYAAAIGHISSHTLVDLYSGIGITSNLAAKKVQKVIGVECVPAAVADADRTAAINGNAQKITNVCGQVEEVLPQIIDGTHDFDVLLDPPRKGCGSNVMHAIAAARPNKVVYISCNHATMCRDISDFQSANKDYVITQVTLFDMFPDTHHVECMTVLELKK